jgi:uncharacterized protein
MRDFRQAGGMRVAVTGSSGLIGSALVSLLSGGGHEVVQLVRRPAHDGGERLWAPADPDPGLLDGIDAVVHLAGHPIAGRFTARHKEAVVSSRVGPTRRLSELARDGMTFVCSSAVGFYGPDRGSEVLTESSPRGRGFLADLVADWEAATLPATSAGARVVNLRTGIVQSRRGGALKVMYPLFAAGLGGRIGSGSQWMAWIAIDDMLDVIVRALTDDRLSGPVNAVAPNPVTNRDYANTLARVLRRPALLPVPAFGPRLLLGGEGATEFALAGQRAIPERLIEVGHSFRHPDLEGALRHVLGRDAPAHTVD